MVNSVDGATGSRPIMRQSAPEPAQTNTAPKSSSSSSSGVSPTRQAEVFNEGLTKVDNPLFEFDKGTTQVDNPLFDTKSDKSGSVDDGAQGANSSSEAKSEKLGFGSFISVAQSSPSTASSASQGTPETTALDDNAKVMKEQLKHKVDKQAISDHLENMISLQSRINARMPQTEGISMQTSSATPHVSDRSTLEEVRTGFARAEAQSSSNIERMIASAIRRGNT